MKRAALYARVSRPDQSIALQLDEGKQLVAQRRWKLVETFADEGISGTKARRPALDAMLTAAKRGKFDVLIVWRSDRLFRSLSNMVATIAELQAWKIEFVSVMEPFDTTTPAGKLSLHIIFAMAEFERALIAERSAAGVAAARRRGKRIGRPRVYVDVTKARRMMRPGVSLREVAQKLKVPRTTLARALRGKVGPHGLRACCGSQATAPHFAACRGIGQQLAATASNRKENRHG